MPTLTASVAVDEGFALALSVAADLLFEEQADSFNVLKGLLSNQNVTTSTATILALLARLLSQVDLASTDGVIDTLVGRMEERDGVRARELLAVVLNDGLMSVTELERTRHQAGSDILLLAEMTLLLSAVLGAGEGRGPGEYLREVTGW